MADSKEPSKSEKTGNDKKPNLVKVISILYFLFAFGLFAYVVVFALDIFGAFSFGASLGMPSSAVSLGAIFFFIPIVIALGISFLLFYGGLRLWQGQNWARILIVVLSGVFAFYGLLSLSIPGVVILLVNLAIGIYLLANKEVSDYFGEI